MRRNVKIVLGGVALALLLVAILAAMLWQDPDRFRPQLAALLSEAAGAPVAVDGPMRWFWQPTLALEVSQLSMHQPSLTVRIDRLAVYADLLGMLRGELRLQRLFAVGVLVDLSSGHSADSALALPDPAKLPLDRLTIENLRLQRNGQQFIEIERIAFDGTARDTAVPFEMTVDSTLSASARIQIDGEKIRFHDLLLHTPVGEVRGTLAVDIAAQLPTLSAELRAERLTLATQRSDSSSARLIPRVSLDLAALQWIDADIELAVDALALGDLRLQNVLLPATLRQGHLHLTATAGLSGGLLSLDADVRATQQRWRSKVSIAAANAGQLLALLGLQQVREGGVVDLLAELDGEGANTDDLLNSLRGDVSLRLADVSIDAGVAKLAGADVLSGLMHAMRGTGAEPIKLRCAVADFEVRAGQLRSVDSIGAQTQLSNLLGGGVISLPQESMDLVIRPWPREGLGLSATMLSGSVSVRGPLRQPRVALTEAAILRTGASAGAALLSGGLSLIAQGLLERARGDTPCEQALGQQKVERGGKDLAASVKHSSGSVAKTLSEGTSSAVESASRGAKSVAKSVSKGVQGLGQSLKGLFGGGSSGGTQGPDRTEDRN
ncbi:MAG: hypothetical protein ACI8W7_000426 [Gammaproteobacteria bacterium]|jgi:uncharacterized protein involved in outer membrane biogenesis